jgi:hypothetical protein
VEIRSSFLTNKGKIIQKWKQIYTIFKEKK